MMYQPRKSILQMFDPLMANSPSTPKREETDASPDNSDKENDAPRDPLSLSQYFNRVYHVKGSQQPFAPIGKLIDFGDATIDEDDDLTPSGPSVAATELQLDNPDVLLSTSPTDPHDEGDTKNTLFPSGRAFVTPQNRKILGEIDVDALQPPKPPTKPGALKISFLATPNGGPSPEEISTANVPPSDSEQDDAILGPVITLYPPTFDSIPPVSSAPQISDKVDDYLSPQHSHPRPVATFADRRSPLSSEPNSHRVSMDLQSSFQLQLQNGEYTFNLINDKISFLESSQELPFPESDEDSDMVGVVEDVSVEDMLKSLTLQDKGVPTPKRLPSPTPEEFTIAPIPEKGSEPPFESKTIRVVSPVSVSSSSQETGPTKAVLSVAQKPARPLPRPSLASRSSISGFKPVATVSKPPMRVLVPPTKRPSSTTSTQRASVSRPSSRQSATMGNLPKPVVPMVKTAGKSTDGPRRVLVQASDEQASRPVSTSTMPAQKTQGPQRVLLGAVPGTTRPAKKPLGFSSSINPSASTSRLPGPSRIAVPSSSKLMTRASSIPKSAGRWV